MEKLIVFGIAVILASTTNTAVIPEDSTSLPETTTTVYSSDEPTEPPTYLELKTEYPANFLEEKTENPSTYLEMKTEEPLTYIEVKTEAPPNFLEIKPEDPPSTNIEVIPEEPPTKLEIKPEEPAIDLEVIPEGPPVYVDVNYIKLKPEEAPTYFEKIDREIEWKIQLPKNASVKKQKKLFNKMMPFVANQFNILREKKRIENRDYWHDDRFITQDEKTDRPFSLEDVQEYFTVGKANISEDDNVATIKITFTDKIYTELDRMNVRETLWYQRVLEQRHSAWTKGY